MSFTDRFIQLPIKTYDKKHKELTGECIMDDSWIRILPFEIASYRPSWDEDDPQSNEIVLITQKSGDTTLVYLSVEEFENKLNTFLNQSS